LDVIEKANNLIGEEYSKAEEIGKSLISNAALERLLNTYGYRSLAGIKYKKWKKAILLL